jgi:hypothetical protein
VLLALFLLHHLAGCADDGTSARSLPILDGADDTEADAVVMAGHAMMMCTATLVMPDLVLTARHCLAVDPGPSPICPVDGEPTPLGELHALEDLLVYSADGLDDPAGQYLEVAEVFSLPDGATRPACGGDIVALRLAGPGGPAPIEPGFEPVEVDDLLSVVGFGNRAPSDDMSAGQRRRDTARVIDVGERAVDRSSGIVGMGPEDFAVDRGPCAGDSGGPAIDSRGHLVGVMSRGPRETCENMVYTAVSPHAAWLRELGRASADRIGAPHPDWAVEPAPDGGAEDPDSGGHGGQSRDAGDVGSDADAEPPGPTRQAASGCAVTCGPPPVAHGSLGVLLLLVVGRFLVGRAGSTPTTGGPNARQTPGRICAGRY